MLFYYVFIFSQLFTQLDSVTTKPTMAPLSLLIMYLFSYVSADIDTTATPWDYGHPDNWHQAYPDCAAADESPINIETEDAISDTDKCSGQFDWEIDFNHKTFKIINNAHSLQVV